MFVYYQLVHISLCVGIRKVKMSNSARTNLRQFQIGYGREDPDDRVFWRSLLTCSLKENMQILCKVYFRLVSL